MIGKFWYLHCQVSSVTVSGCRYLHLHSNSMASCHIRCCHPRRVNMISYYPSESLRNVTWYVMKTTTALIICCGGISKTQVIQANTGTNGHQSASSKETWFWCNCLSYGCLPCWPAVYSNTYSVGTIMIADHPPCSWTRVMAQTVTQQCQCRQASGPNWSPLHFPSHRSLHDQVLKQLMARLFKILGNHPAPRPFLQKIKIKKSHFGNEDGYQSWSWGWFSE